jgi:deoxycytidylate deaminase
MAHEYALEFSGCTKVQVGSLITDSAGNILALGANVSIPNLCKTRGCMRIEKYGDNAKEHRLPSDCRALHSEIDAISHLDDRRNAAVIHVTRYPCEACARAIVAAGLTFVVYGRTESISAETKAIFDSAGVTCMHYFWVAEDDNN